MTKFWLAAGCFAIAAAPAAAQPASPPPAIIQEITACRAIEDQAARLVCYDGGVGRLAGLVSARDVVILDREEVRKTRRSLFGFSLPRLPFFGGGNRDDGNSDADEITEITAAIISTADLGNGRFQIALKDGGVWRTTEVARFPPKVGASATVSKAALGSYFMKFGSGRGVRAMRVN